MNAKLLRWGNSYGIRLSKRDVEQAGLHEGQEISVDVRATPHQRVDLSWLKPVVNDGTLAMHHDDHDPA